MKLFNGITGFFDSENNLPPDVDGAKLKQLCFAITTQIGGKVLEFNEPKYPMNFYYVKVKVFNEHFHILLNEHYPYLAFASVVQFERIHFIDVPKPLEQFKSFYKVLSAKELNEPLVLNSGSKKNIVQNDNDLNSSELEQIAYWKPERIGEVIFNYWD